MKRYGSDFKKIDAHTVRPHEYKEAPEWTDAQIASADLHENGRLIRRGRDDETAHLLSSSKNAERLRSALRQAEAGDLVERELDGRDRKRPRITARMLTEAEAYLRRKGQIV
jgi:hypothetical protein